MIHIHEVRGSNPLTSTDGFAQNRKDFGHPAPDVVLGESTIVHINKSMINCKFEKGHKARLRHVTVDVMVLTPDESEILLVKRAPNITQGDKWDMPGGFLDRDETLYEGVKRELKEETGHEVEDIKVFRINSDPKRAREDRQNVAFVFVAHARKQPIKFDWESTEVKWRKISDLPEEDEFAFDNYESIDMYFNGGHKESSWPIIS
jgi:ADP-ribose pyrophosphatase YjhB (NUDIX family)